MTYGERRAEKCRAFSLMGRSTLAAGLLGSGSHRLMRPPMRTFLHLALQRPNLQLVTLALVHRVLFAGKRATGIEFSRAAPSSGPMPGAR